MAISTGLGRYEEGMRLEAAGMSGVKVAQKLGYKDAQSWYGTKRYYSKRQQGLAARCTPRTESAPEPHPMLQDLPERVPIPNRQGGTVEKRWGSDGEAVAEPVTPMASQLITDEQKEGDRDPAVQAAERALVEVRERRVSLEGAVASYQLTESHLRLKMRSAHKSATFSEVRLEDLGGLIAELSELAACHIGGKKTAR